MTDQAPFVEFVPMLKWAPSKDVEKWFEAGMVAWDIDVRVNGFSVGTIDRKYAEKITAAIKAGATNPKVGS